MLYVVNPTTWFSLFETELGVSERHRYVKHIASQKRIAVHSQRLRTQLACQCRPCACYPGSIRQQAPSGIVEHTSEYGW